MLSKRRVVLLKHTLISIPEISILGTLRSEIIGRNTHIHKHARTRTHAHSDNNTARRFLVCFIKRFQSFYFSRRPIYFLSKLCSLEKNYLLVIVSEPSEVRVLWIRVWRNWCASWMFTLLYLVLHEIPIFNFSSLVDTWPILVLNLLEGQSDFYLGFIS